MARATPVMEYLASRSQYGQPWLTPVPRYSCAVANGAGGRIEERISAWLGRIEKYSCG